VLPVLDQLIQLAAGLDLILTEVPPATAGLLASARTDWAQVSGHVRDGLSSNNDRVRDDAAAAVGCMLVADATRVVGLGPALVASIRRPDRGYAGEPHPASSAARALAEAWRQEPQTGMRGCSYLCEHSLDRVSLICCVCVRSSSGNSAGRCDWAEQVARGSVRYRRVRCRYQLRHRPIEDTTAAVHVDKPSVLVSPSATARQHPARITIQRRSWRPVGPAGARARLGAYGLEFPPVRSQPVKKFLNMFFCLAWSPT
jgi:hypothetical protein